MIAWDPTAVHKPVDESTGRWEGPHHPKGLIHTTEGFDLAGAYTTYRRNGYAPHVTFGPDPRGGERTVRWQHFPFTSRATTLADHSGGVRTNRLYVWQVEVVGTCDDQWKTRQGGKFAWLHVDNWPDWYRDALAALMLDWEEWLGIPRHNGVEWLPYPKSAQAGGKQRLTGAEYEAYSGWLGHEHPPEQTHGDPGALDVADLFARMALLSGQSTPAAPIPTPDDTTEDDDMAAPAQLVQVKRADGTLDGAVWAVTLTGARHVKNKVHLDLLRKSGQVTNDIEPVTQAQLDQLREKEGAPYA